LGFCNELIIRPTTNLILHDVELPDITYRDALDKPLSEYREKDRVDIIVANPPFGGVVGDGMETNFPLNYRTKESADLFLILFRRTAVSFVF
jgi:type I restriction enzyme M protein